MFLFILLMINVSAGSGTSGERWCNIHGVNFRILGHTATTDTTAGREAGREGERERGREGGRKVGTKGRRDGGTVGTERRRDGGRGFKRH